MFVLLRCFAEMVDDDSKSRTPIADLIVELYKLQPKTGYFLLYFLRARYNRFTAIIIILVVLFFCLSINAFIVKPTNLSLHHTAKSAKLVIWK